MVRAEPSLPAIVSVELPLYAVNLGPLWLVILVILAVAAIVVMARRVRR
jgi:hypothetical protein